MRTIEERDHIEVLLEEVRPSDVVWDIGANRGIYSLPLASVAKRVISFEPNPKTAAKLEENARRNQGSIELRKVALSDSDGTASLEWDGPAYRTGMGAASIVNNYPEGQQLTVETRRGDGIDAPQPAIIKIDVEGAEIDVLNGLEKTLQSDACRLVQVAVHKGVDDRDCRSKLEDAGFTVDVARTPESVEVAEGIKHADDMCILFAWKDLTDPVSQSLIRP